MSAKPFTGLKPRTDREEPISEKDSGCYVCGRRPIGVEVVTDGTRDVCAEHAPTGGDD